MKKNMFNQIQKRVVEKSTRGLIQLGKKMYTNMMKQKPWYVSKARWSKIVTHALTEM